MHFRHPNPALRFWSPDAERETKLSTPAGKKNAQITAIYISKNNSLAYAVSKPQEYKMNNVRLQQIDILDANQFHDVYGVIECSGVLHYMQDPAKGLTALNSKLKIFGYIKIGLYSKLARQKVSVARDPAQKLDIQSIPVAIKHFEGKYLTMIIINSKISQPSWMNSIHSQSVATFVFMYKSTNSPPSHRTNF